MKVVKVEDWEREIASTTIFEFTLTTFKPQVSHIPAGFANGLQATSENSKLLILSDYNLDEVEDNYKFNPYTFLKF